MQLTLISHFYNEAFLLPYWLENHRFLFDHGVMINYSSTDASCDIIREICPTWEIRRSENEWFDAWKLEPEVMAVEREFPGWKAVLNTTEFLLTEDLRRDLAIWQAIDPTTPALEFRTCTMVDPLDQKNVPIRAAPLVLQRHHGTFAPGRLARGRRFMHRAPMGHYGIGRHSIGLPSRPSLLHLLWFGYAPYDQVKQRKMQIGRRVPMENLMQGMGNHHLRTKEELDRDYYELAATAVDLLTDPHYRCAYHCVQRWYGLPKRGDISSGRV